MTIHRESKPTRTDAKAGRTIELQVHTVIDAEAWNALISTLGGHPLQNSGWGDHKVATGNWDVTRVRVEDPEGAIVGAAQILTRHLPLPFRKLHYVARGPAVRDDDLRKDVTTAIASWAKSNLKGIGITFEPEWPAAADAPERPDDAAKLPTAILCDNTLILDLTQSEDELMADMAKKTRQYVRKSGRESIVVRELTDLTIVDACLKIYEDTAERAGFQLYSRDYYRRAFEMLGGNSAVFAAFEIPEGTDPESAEPDSSAMLSFVWLAANDTEAFELWGGMNSRGQHLRANYALKWHAIATYKERGLTKYDLNGLLNDGISQFKRGFARHENRLIGPLDFPFSPLFTAWQKSLPAAKRVVQRLRSVTKR